MAALPDDRSLGVKIARAMTYNSAAYRSRRFARRLPRLKITHLRTKPYTLRTPGRAGRFIQPLLREWADAYRYSHQRIARMRSRLGCFIKTSIGLSRRSATGFPLRGSALRETMCWEITAIRPDGCRCPTGQARRRRIVCAHTHAIPIPSAAAKAPGHRRRFRWKDLAELYQGIVKGG